MIQFVYKLTLLSLIVIITSCANDLSITKNNGFCIASYNTENLFDTLNNPTTYDDDFTPNGKMHYDTYRYNNKIRHIAQVINDLNSTSPIAIMALNEIENETVLIDLIKELNTPLFYIQHKGNDPRGIDNALLYDTAFFRPIYSKQIVIPHLHTRNILYTKGILQADTVHVFVNHWPSRSGGKDESEYKRLAASAILQFHLDSILQLNPKANIVFLGDFNDDATNKSLSTLLNNRPFTTFTNSTNVASYKYKSDWTMLDHIIYTNTFTTKYTINENVFITNYLLEIDKKYGKEKPYRSYNGSQYIDGYSDHLPIYIALKQKNK